jgi:hypothetical protein
MQREKRSRYIYWLALLVFLMGIGMVALQSSAVTAEINAPEALWGDEKHISTNSPTGAFVPVIDRAPDGTLMVVYRHRTAGGFNIPYYTQSTNEGGTWSTPAAVRLSSSEIPQVSFAFDNNSVAHAVWRTGSDIIHSVKGQWPAPGTPIADTVEMVLDPDIDVADNNRLHVVWAQGQDLQTLNIYHAYSNNGGASWTISPPLATNTNKSIAPAVSVDNLGNVHVTWEERTFNIDIGDFVTAIHYKKGTWSGNTLTFAATPTTVSDPDINSNRPDIVATDDGRVHISYMELASDDEQYAMYVLYNGTTWLPPVDTTNNSQVGVNQSDPFFLITSLAVCDNIAYLYYHGALSPTANEQILGSNSGDNWVYREQVTDTTTRSINPSLACDGSRLFLAFVRIEEAGPNADTNQVYFVTTGGGSFLPAIFRK